MTSLTDNPHYKAFHGFGQAKLGYGGLVFGMSSASSKGGKNDLEIIISLCKSKIHDTL